MTARSAPLSRRLLVGAFAVSLTAAIVGSGPAGAASAPVGMGVATSFAVLAGTTVTNTGPSVISGNLGVSPGTAVTHFPPGKVINGQIHSADKLAGQAKADAGIAYGDAAGRKPDALVVKDLGGQKLVAGTYKAASSMGLTGTVTLDAQGDPHAVFIFQAGSTLTAATNSTVSLINGADPCNVVWQVGSSATLRAGTTFVGTVLALTAITAQTGASVRGRLLALNAAVTLDDNTITQPGCAVVGTTTSTTTSTTTTASSTTAPVTTTTPGGTTTVPVTTTTPGGTTTSTVPTSTTTPGVTTSPGTGLTTTTRPAIITNSSSSSSSSPPLARTGAPLSTTALAGTVALLLGAVLVLTARSATSDDGRPPTT